MTKCECCGLEHNEIDIVNFTTNDPYIFEGKTFNHLCTDCITDLEKGKAINALDVLSEKITKPHEKAEWTILHWKSIEKLVYVMMFGKEKHGFENWKKPENIPKCRNALLRHAVACEMGEWLDEETKIPHVIHVMANCMILDYHMTDKPEVKK